MAKILGLQSHYLHLVIMKSKKPLISDAEQVNKHIALLEPVLRVAVEKIRKIILATSPEISEG